MILGVTFFSYIMSTFTGILTSYDRRMGHEDKNADLQIWVTTLSNKDEIKNFK